MAPNVYQFDDPAYTIRLDAVRGLLHIAFRGFWTDAIYDRFVAHARSLLPTMPLVGVAIGTQRTLLDLTGYAVQDKAMLDRLAVIGNDTDLVGRRVATLLASALLRQQARRTVPGHRCFSDRDEALAWLLEDATGAEAILPPVR